MVQIEILVQPSNFSKPSHLSSNKLPLSLTDTTGGGISIAASKPSHLSSNKLPLSLTDTTGGGISIAAAQEPISKAMFKPAGS